MGFRFSRAKMKLGKAVKGRGPSGKVFLSSTDGLKVITQSTLLKLQRSKTEMPKWPVLSLSEAIMVDPWSIPRIAGNDSSYPTEAGIYFIFVSADLVYIGQSKNIKQRLRNHNVLRDLKQSHPLDKIFTAFMLVNITELDCIEYSLIKTFCPPINKKMSPTDFVM